MAKKKSINRDNYYGGPIISNGIWSFFPKLKNKILTKAQYRILKHFSHLRERSAYSRAFSTLARKVIGPYIYSLKIEVSNICEQHCQMCYVKKGQVNLSGSLIEKTFKEIRNSGARIEILGGEPLIRQDIISIIQKAKRIAKTPFVSIYTNGTRITYELVQNLKKAGLDAAIVSLISVDPDNHDQFTGVKGSWSATIKGIKLLREAGIETYTFSAIHRRNIDETNEIFKYVKEKLMVHPLFYQYIPQSKDDPLIVSPEEWYAVKNRILRQIPDHATFVRDFYMLTGNACSGGNFVLTIKNDGSVQPCPFISDLPLGNIAEKSIWEIYRNRYAGTALKYLKKVPEKCMNCTYVSVCGGGCRAGNNQLLGTYDSSDQRCLGPYMGKIEKNQVIYKTPCYF